MQIFQFLKWMHKRHGVGPSTPNVRTVSDWSDSFINLKYIHIGTCPQRYWNKMGMASWISKHQKSIPENHDLIHSPGHTKFASFLTLASVTGWEYSDEQSSKCTEDPELICQQVSEPYKLKCPLRWWRIQECWKRNAAYRRHMLRKWLTCSNRWNVGHKALRWIYCTCQDLHLCACGFQNKLGASKFTFCNI